MHQSFTGMKVNQRRKLITRKQKLNQCRGVNTTTTYFIRTLRGGRNG